MNDRELIKGCARHEREAQRQLYEENYSKLMGVCLRYAKDETEAKEMFHEGMMSIYEKIKHYNYHQDFETWLKHLMVDAAVSHLKRNRHEYQIVNTVYVNKKTIGQTQPTIFDDDELISGSDKAEYLQAIQELAPAYRTVYNLYVIDEFPPNEIIQKLDISEATAMSNLSKAKYNLRKNLTQLISSLNG